MSPLLLPLADELGCSQALRRGPHPECTEARGVSELRRRDPPTKRNSACLQSPGGFACLPLYRASAVRACSVGREGEGVDMFTHTDNNCHGN